MQLHVSGTDGNLSEKKFGFNIFSLSLIKVQLIPNNKQDFCQMKYGIQKYNENFTKKSKKICLRFFSIKLMRVLIPERSNVVYTPMELHVYCRASNQVLWKNKLRTSSKA